MRGRQEPAALSGPAFVKQPALAEAADIGLIRVIRVIRGFPSFQFAESLRLWQ
jgi:hypothetical protein